MGVRSCRPAHTPREDWNAQWRNQCGRHSRQTADHCLATSMWRRRPCSCRPRFQVRSACGPTPFATDPTSPRTPRQDSTGRAQDRSPPCARSHRACAATSCRHQLCEIPRALRSQSRGGRSPQPRHGWGPSGARAPARCDGSRSVPCSSRLRRRPLTCTRRTRRTNCGPSALRLCPPTPRWDQTARRRWSRSTSWLPCRRSASTLCRC